MVRRARAPVLGRSVHFSHAAYADGFAEVDVSGYGGGAGVEPVEVVMLLDGIGVSFGWGESRGWEGEGRDKGDIPVD